MSTKQSYKDYLKSDHWKEIKQNSEAIWGRKCVVCSCSKNIHRHHVFYRVNKQETHASEIIPLCNVCHEAFHKDNDTLYGTAESLRQTKRQFKDTVKEIIDKLGLTLNMETVFTKIWNTYLTHYQKDTTILDTWSPIKNKSRKCKVSLKNAKKTIKDNNKQIFVKPKTRNPYSTPVSDKEAEHRWQQHLLWQESQKNKPKKRLGRTLVTELPGKNSRDRQMARVYFLAELDRIQVVPRKLIREELNYPLMSDYPYPVEV